jgi:DNA-directed RNA polymerase specialized sigma24 family protein
MRELADVYAVALRLRDRGVKTAEIADIVGIDAQAVDNHLRIAEAKLARLMEPATDRRDA